MKSHFGHRVFLSLLFYLSPNIWARALPASPQPVSTPGGQTPTQFPTITTYNEPTWIKCDLGTSIGQAPEFNCALVGHNSPLHRRSVEALGVDSHLHNARVDTTPDISHPAANLYPCFFEHEYGPRRLRCKKVDLASRKVLEDSVVWSLVSDLLHGLPISAGPLLTTGPGLDTANFHVSLFPIDDNYDLRLMTAPNLAFSAEAFSSDPLTTTLPLGPSTKVLRDINQSSKLYNKTGLAERSEGFIGLHFTGTLYCWFCENKYGTDTEFNCGAAVEAMIAIQGDSDPRRVDIPSGDLETYGAQIIQYLCSLIIPFLVDQNYADRSMDDWNELPKVIARILVLKLSELQGDINFDMAEFDWTAVVQHVTYNLRRITREQLGLSDTDNLAGIVDFQWLLFYYLNLYSGSGKWLVGVISDEDIGNEFDYILNSLHRNSEKEHIRRQLIWDGSPRMSTGNTLTDSSKGDEKSPPEIIIDRWFRCWDGSGPKVLCETPDWYNAQMSEGEKSAKRVKGLETSDIDKPSPIQFSAEQPRLWHNCKFTMRDGKYRMICPTKPSSEYIGSLPEGANDTERTDSSSLRAKPLLFGRGTETSNSSTITAYQAQDKISSATPSSPAGISCKHSVFGKMGEIFAFTGFFTVLATFTIILFWVLRNLFLVIQNAFSAIREWADRRMWEKSPAKAKDNDPNTILNTPAPAYISNENHFEMCNAGVSVPVNAVLARNRETSTASTGSQVVVEGGDTIKRKKAATRNVVDEEEGIFVVEV